MYWVKISKSDYSISEGVWTLSNVQIVDVGNQRINTTLERNCKACLRSGYLYVMAYDKASVYKINVNNSTDVFEISLGFTSDFESLGESGSYGLYMTLIGDIIMGCDFQILSYDTVIRTAGERIFEHGCSPLFPYKEFLIGWGGRYGTSYRSVYLLTPYLGTMWLCIRNGYTSTAAWLTATVGLAEAVIGAGVTGYLSLCKSDHSEGGITFEAAKSKNFIDDGGDSPRI